MCACVCGGGLVGGTEKHIRLDLTKAEFDEFKPMEMHILYMRITVYGFNRPQV